MALTAKQHRRVERVMSYFDFTKMHSVMTYLKWQWAGGSGPDSVPTMLDLKREARRLLAGVITRPAKGGPRTTSTGGFKALHYEDGTLELEFIVTDWYDGD